MLYSISLLPLALSFIIPLEAVLTRGKVFNLEYQRRKTKVVLLYDVHNIEQFKEREDKQVQELLEALQERNEQQDNYLCILGSVDISAEPYKGPNK